MAKQTMTITFEGETMQSMIEKILEFLQTVGVLKQNAGNDDKSPGGEKQ